MPRVFISNIKIQDEENADIIFSSERGIEQFKEKTIDKSGNTVFVLDVHCRFIYKDGLLKLQEQGGVIIYRDLLKQFERKQDKLKVVFYSPISKENLVALKPENYILTLLPFVQCEYDENFEARLRTEILKHQNDTAFLFNNASENLLSGWALNKAQIEKEKRIGKSMKEKDFVETIYKENGDASKRRLVFIDDQINEWKKTFNIILQQELAPSYLLYEKLNSTTSSFDFSKIPNLDKAAKEADVIISDFYLEETHQPNTWMNNEQLENISGYKIFEKIKGKQNEKGINKGCAYLMHSSSNKIPYYRILEANGLDNWLVKDIRANITAQEKIENFKNFKNSIEEFTSNDRNGLHKALKNLWERIDKLETNNRWWQTNGEYNSDEVIHILKSCWFALKGFANKQTLFMKSAGVVDVNFTPSSIITSLGKLNESFKIEQIQGNCFKKYLVQTRNASSHYLDFDQIELTDTLIFFDSWLNALNGSSYDDVFETNVRLGNSPYMIQDTSGSKPKRFKYRLLYVYMQYFNSPYSNVHSNPRKLIRKRVEELLIKADKSVLLNEVINHVPKNSSDAVIPNAIKLKDRIAVRQIDKANVNNMFSILDSNNQIFITFK